jgi:hypothetical protein
MIESNVEELNDADRSALPRPVTLTPEEVRRVAAGVAVGLPDRGNAFGSATWGMFPPEPGEGPGFIPLFFP